MRGRILGVLVQVVVRYQCGQCLFEILDQHPVVLVYCQRGCSSLQEYVAKPVFGAAFTDYFPDLLGKVMKTVGFCGDFDYIAVNHAITLVGEDKEDLNPACRKKFPLLVEYLSICPYI